MDQLDPLLNTTTGFWTLIQARFGVLLMTARLARIIHDGDGPRRRSANFAGGFGRVKRSVIF